MFPHHFRKLGISSLNMVICSFDSFCVAAFHVKSIKNDEIYMTVLDFYEIWCVGLRSNLTQQCLNWSKCLSVKIKSYVYILIYTLIYIDIPHDHGDFWIIIKPCLHKALVRSYQLWKFLNGNGTHIQAPSCPPLMNSWIEMKVNAPLSCYILK